MMKSLCFLGALGAFATRAPFPSLKEATTDPKTAYVKARAKVKGIEDQTVTAFEVSPKAGKLDLQWYKFRYGGTQDLRQSAEETCTVDEDPNPVLIRRCQLLTTAFGGHGASEELAWRAAQATERLKHAPKGGCKHGKLEEGHMHLWAVYSPATQSLKDPDMGHWAGHSSMVLVDAESVIELNRMGVFFHQSCAQSRERRRTSDCPTSQTRLCDMNPVTGEHLGTPGWALHYRFYSHRAENAFGMVHHVSPRHLRFWYAGVVDLSKIEDAPTHEWAKFGDYTFLRRKYKQEDTPWPSVSDSVPFAMFEASDKYRWWGNYWRTAYNSAVGGWATMEKIAKVAPKAVASVKHVHKLTHWLQKTEEAHPFTNAMWSCATFTEVGIQAFFPSLASEWFGDDSGIPIGAPQRSGRSKQIGMYRDQARKAGIEDYQATRKEWITEAVEALRSKVHTGEVAGLGPNVVLPPFEVAKHQVALYTIQNEASGLYMQWKDGSMSMGLEPENALSKWSVQDEGKSGFVIGSQGQLQHTGKVTYVHIVLVPVGGGLFRMKKRHVDEYATAGAADVTFSADQGAGATGLWRIQEWNRAKSEALRLFNCIKDEGDESPLPPLQVTSRPCTDEEKTKPA